MFDIDKICTAIRSQNRREIDTHLVQGGDYNKQSETRITALYAACSVEDPISVERILRYGGDPNISGEDRIAPLHVVLQASPIAQYEGCTKIVDLLLKAGARVDNTTFNGRTPLMSAQIFEHIEKIIAYNPDINARDNDDNTALHHQIEQFSFVKDAHPVADKIGLDHAKNILQSVSLLLEKGADIDAVNKAGKTPMNLAMQSQNGPLQQLFMSARSKRQDIINKTFQESARKKETAARNTTMKHIFQHNKNIIPKRRR